MTNTVLFGGGLEHHAGIHLLERIILKRELKEKNNSISHIYK